MRALRLAGATAALAATIACGPSPNAPPDAPPNARRTAPPNAPPTAPPDARSTGSGTGAAGGGPSPAPIGPDSTTGDAPPAEAHLFFVDATEESGLSGFRQVNGGIDKATIVDSVGGGVAFLDYDGDGDIDIYLTNGSRNAGSPAGAEPRDALYRNEGDGRFTDVTASAGLGHPGWTNGVVVADIDGDGWSDLYLTVFGPNVLLRNEGDGTFEDITESSGLGDPSWSTGAAFFDADGDDDLDLYVANYVDFDPDFAPDDPALCTHRGIMVFYGPKGLAVAADRFYRNEGGGRFVDATEAAGIRDDVGYGFQVVPFDADGDGDQDVFVANDSTPNFLWINAGDGTFEESGLLAGVALSEMGKEQGTMGAALGDQDGDGRLDLYVTNFAEDYYTLYRNQGGGYFVDVTFRLDLGERTYAALGWGCSLFDPDNDGDLDIFAANGHVYPQVDRLDLGTSYLQRNQIFEQVSPGRFVERTASAGPGVLVKASSRGSAIGDYDDDGDLDIVVNNLDDRPTLLRNDGAGLGGWVKVQAIGRPPNTDALGAVVRVRAGALSLTQAVLSSNSFLSVDDRRLHFGLGGATTVDLVEVTWADGSVTSGRGLPVGRLVVARQQGGTLEAGAPWK